MRTNERRPREPDIAPNHIEHVDAPMACCGMLSGHGFSNPVFTGVEIKHTTWNGMERWVPETRAATKDDVILRLQNLKDIANDNGRNCVLITLSSSQPLEREAAEQEGFKVIFEFYNPNSGNQCYVMAYTKYANYEEYRESYGGDDDDEDDY